MSKTKKLQLIAAAALLASAFSAQAQTAGSWLARIGATNISPDVTSGDLTAPSLPGTKVDINDSTQLGGGITYMLTDNWAIDLPLAMPFKHTLSGDGAIAGVGKLGDVKALPFTLLGQYRFMAPNAQLRPYVGAGITYAKFYHSRSTGVLSSLTGGSPTTFTVDSKWAPTVQLGVVFNVNEKVFVDTMISKTWLKTTSHLSTGQTIDTKLDPISMSIGIGMRFR
ncbi:OmpW family protein [Caenimonas koreensis]|uniref:OmpW/AlkL family protein n=1 Tax=Caenimonas koreensis TaxID=367474 RepID=UPI00378341F2